MANVQNGVGEMDVTFEDINVAVEKQCAAGFSRQAQANSALLLGFILCSLQALDGILTSMGVSRFGTAIEGNPLIRTLMEEFGHVTALGLVKFCAILVVIALTCFAKRLPWVNNAMGAISCIYVFAAIIPWTYILFLKPLF